MNTLILIVAACSSNSTLPPNRPAEPMTIEPTIIPSASLASLTQGLKQVDDVQVRTLDSSTALVAISAWSDASHVGVAGFNAEIDVFRTADRGESWSLVLEDTHPDILSWAGEQTVWLQTQLERAGRSKALWVSLDGGRQWESRVLPPDPSHAGAFVGLDMRDDGRGRIQRRGGAWFSTMDGGVSWVEEGTERPQLAKPAEPMESFLRSHDANGRWLLERRSQDGWTVLTRWKGGNSVRGDGTSAPNRRFKVDFRAE